MKRILVALLMLTFTLPVLAENTILIVGDSLSAGYGIAPEHGWVALLRQRLQDRDYPYRVINASISGDTTSNGLLRLPGALKQYQPAITILELGGNDGLRGLQLTTIKANLQMMIQLVKQAGSNVLLVGLRLPPNYGPLYTQRFQQIYTDLAQQNKIELVPQFLQGIDIHPDLMQPDGIHPVEKAQFTLLANVWGKLEALLKK